MREPEELEAHLAAAAALYAARVQAMPPATTHDVLDEVAERAIWQAGAFASQWARFLKDESRLRDEDAVK